MSKHIEDKGDKMELKDRCRQLQKEREEMWERLGMNWTESSCLPRAKEKASCSFLTTLLIK